MNEWIARSSTPGQRCDECGLHLREGDPVSTATVAMTGEMSGYELLHAICPRCVNTETPSIRAKCDRFLSRIVSTRASAFIHDLIEPQAAVN